MRYKIGIASSDGKVVNLHFGKASVFYIVEADSETMTFQYIESRTTEPVCQGQEHDEDQLLLLADRLKDCDYVLVSQIGNGARAALDRFHIDAYELPGLLEESIQRLLSFVEVQKLFVER